MVKIKTDILIIGSGPAGLNAAYTAASHGANVIIVDEAITIGGQLKQQTQILNNLPGEFNSQRGFSLVDDFYERLKSLPITFLLRHTMIGIYKNNSIGVTNGKETFPITYKKLIIATGAAEEATIFPGWTLPGVMTIGAAQILLNREHVLPGNEAIILGFNEFSLEVGKQLESCGVNIKAIVAKGNYDVELFHEAKNVGIRVVSNATIISATGVNEVEKVVLNIDGIEEEHMVDLVCIGNRLSPILEAFEILSCQLAYQEDLGGLFPKYYNSLETTNTSVYVAGNAAGITNIGGILITGEIAAWNALYSLELLEYSQFKNRSRALWEQLYRIEESQVFKARIAAIKETYKDESLALPPFVELLLEEC
ncbi:NAD(P)/FAD-dependent oxidoreductase [Sporosarcina sp. ACRSM]|uniref:NAD(P)/FAD-dependent oxidoreductase n=1 Tax=Sporosarcina sp. ACRSM TaxID=2918216 RepID=UPI001EF7390E|nr:NAD(P)/FAD-dependent oxidoreductase [Sporosarcina sp. ACRSM]